MNTQDLSEEVGGVRVVRWNPLKADGTSRIDNFGDLLGPRIVERLAPAVGDHSEFRSLLSVGSVMQFAAPGDVVWGSGVNAKLRLRRTNPRRTFDVRAVRGRLSGLALAAEGSTVPEVFGDPALLLPEVFPETNAWATAGQKRRGVVIVPNVNDFDAFPASADVVSPTGEAWSVIRQLLSAELVVGSSLHAIIVAEAYGIPARAVRSASESIVKYVDYYSGTGREDVEIAESVGHALELGGAPSAVSSPSGALLATFPADLWVRDHGVVPDPAVHRPLGDIASEVRDRAVRASGADREAWSVLAQRTVLPMLRDRAHTIDRDQLEQVVGAGRDLIDAGLLRAPDERFDRTRTLLDLNLAADLARASLENSGGYRAVLADVVRAGSDGRLELTGTLQLPDAPLREYDLTVALVDEERGDRIMLNGSQWSELSPASGLVRWSCAVEVDDFPRGSWVPIIRIQEVGDSRDEPVRSAPPLSFPRWWTARSSYRVDRTARGHVVVHLEEKELAR